MFEEDVVNFLIRIILLVLFLSRECGRWKTTQNQTKNCELRIPGGFLLMKMLTGKLLRSLNRLSFNPGECTHARGKLCVKQRFIDIYVFLCLLCKTNTHNTFIPTRRQQRQIAGTSFPTTTAGLIVA